MALRPRQVTPELLHKVTKALGITSLDQWYYVSQTAVAHAIGSERALNNYGGNIAGFLKSAYPNHHFDEERLSSRKYLEKDQKFVELIIRKLFPNDEIHTKAKKAVGIINPETDAYLEIDFWIPSLKLGIEYQDKHHYGYQWYANDTLEDYQKRDSIKKAAMSTLGHTLIIIGCWWDKTPESLATTIRKYRPDLLQEYESVSAELIPSDPPPGYLASSRIIPGVDGIMSPFIPKYKSFNPTNWYACEKYDGIRGVYNPKLNKVFSRSGNELSIHSCLLDDIPDILVEGEITAGRGNYNKTASVSFHAHHDKVDWAVFRYVLFDIPDATVGSFNQRYSSIVSGLSTRPFIFAQSTSPLLIHDKSHLKMLVDSIICDSGEGMIAQKDAPYEYGRSSTLAKIKVRRDADAQVLSVNKLSCTCKLVHGVTVNIMFSDGFDSSELKMVDIVSYYYNGTSQGGKPKQAEIYKIRYDVTWEMILSDKAQNIAKRRSVKDAVGSSSLNALARNKSGHWNNPQNVRAFFDDLALKSEFDPLVPQNWYKVSTISLRNAGGGSLFYAQGFNMKKALSRAYPELKFEDKFRTRSAREDGKTKNTYGYWTKSQNLRAFLDDFARTSGFEPLVVENWYSINAINLRKAGGGGLLNAYTLKKALKRAYPELSFGDKFKAAKKSKGYWSEAQNVRTFCDEFARKAGFEPLVPGNWYTVNIRTFIKAGGGSAHKEYDYKLHKLLTCAYPELKFEVAKFRTFSKGR